MSRLTLLLPAILLVACSLAVTAPPVVTLPAKTQPGAIEVPGAETTDWPDASWAARKLGVLYVPVVTPGLRVSLRSARRTHDYHTDLAGRVVLCPEGGPPAAAPFPAEVNVPHAS